ncbi:MAG: Mfa1 family fimbria major subunit [Muribaculaceae bacterium]|nr:Mfa1 family fimbria major subunit [Muribaculaceae bacterium]
MKLKNIALFPILAAGICGCSNDINENKIPDGTGADEGYVSIGVALPVTAATKADNTLTYEEGEPQEYAVTNGKLLLFNKADGKLVCTAELTGMTWSATPGEEITTSAKAHARLTGIDMRNKDAQYQVAAVLNYTPDFKFPQPGETYSAWSVAAQNSPMILSEGGKQWLTMSSAPCASVNGSAPVTLVDLDKSRIAATENELSGTPAAQVTVQRAVAKVTVENSGEITPAGQDYSSDKVEIIAWGLDITNRTSFPMQVTDGLASGYSEIWNKARFMGPENSKFRRIYWGIDPNYDCNITTLADVNTHFNTISNESLTSMPKVAYCLENTFDINHQMQGHTTRVVFKAQYTPAGFSKGDSFMRIGISSHFYTVASLTEEITRCAKSVVNSENVVVEMPGVANRAGSYSLSQLSIKKNGNYISADEQNRIARAIGLKAAADKGIHSYPGGICYYAARIKHFGDTETPWALGESTYDGDNSRWLGRYGMVRNNHYEIYINSISRPGEPNMPVIDPLIPDDENNTYVELAISVLSWAKRVNYSDL